MSGGLAALIRHSWQGWLDEPLEATVFGTTDADAIARALEELVREQLGATVEHALGYHASVGCTALVGLSDRRTVAIKVHQPHTSTTFLTAVVGVQRHLHAAGFPAPEPLVGPVPIAGTQATVETLLPDPGPPPADATVRRASAAGLAALVDAARPLVRGTIPIGLDEHPMIEGGGALWGRPHSPLFDFDAPTPDASRIDAWARAAKEARDADPSEPVVAHGDWTARNIRVVDGRLTAVFDWDSVARLRETRAVGQAAQTWSATGDADGPPQPDAAGVAAFVTDYEQARGTPFTARERRAIGGAALYTLAYTARCEAALRARWPDHAGHPRQALDRLEADGDQLLSLEFRGAPGSRRAADRR